MNKTMNKTMNKAKQLFDLTGKRVLVTGAGRANGIGAAIAQGMAEFGAQVAIHDRETIEQTVITNIEQFGQRCHFFPQDLSVIGAGRRLIEKVEEDFGPLDIVVTNASYQCLGDFFTVTDEQVEQQININFRAHFELLQTVLPKMVKRGGGRIVHIGSINQRAPKAIVSIYAAMKAAQHNLLSSLAREYAKDGVLLNSIAPGLIDTYPESRQGNAQACENWDNYAQQLNWLGRAGTPDEIVGAAVYLAAPASTFMTGETIYISGGF